MVYDYQKIYLLQKFFTETTETKSNHLDLRDKVSDLIQYVSDPDTVIEEDEESVIEPLYYIFKAYENTHNNKNYNIKDYVTYMNKYYNIPLTQAIYNPCLLKPASYPMLKVDGKTNNVARTILEHSIINPDITKLSSELIEAYESQYLEYIVLKPSLYSDPTLNPYTRSTMTISVLLDPYKKCFDTDLTGIKREFYLYLCGMKISKDRNKWLKAMNQKCTTNTECATKCCHEEQCASKHMCSEE